MGKVQKQKQQTKVHLSSNKIIVHDKITSNTPRAFKSRTQLTRTPIRTNTLDSTNCNNINPGLKKKSTADVTNTNTSINITAPPFAATTIRKVVNLSKISNSNDIEKRKKMKEVQEKKKEDEEREKEKEKEEEKEKKEQEKKEQEEKKKKE